MVYNWQGYAVEDLLSGSDLYIGDGYRAKRSELAKTGIPFARAGNINNGFQFQDADRFPEKDLAKVGIKISQPDDVVFTSKGTVGRFAFVRKSTERFVYAPQLSFWRVLDKQVIEPRFLYYWMYGREFHLQFYGVKGQTDMADYVSLRDQRRMQITLPPLPEQHAIAHILGALDDKIELNRQLNHTLEAIARAIFKSWFVDFDPVHAKAEGRAPAGMDAATAALFPDAFVPSELGLIPKGWRIGTLQEAATITMGLSPKGSTYNEDGIGTPLVNGPVEFGEYFLERKKWTTAPTRLSEEGDLILCVRGSTTGKRVIADGVYCLGRGVCSIQAKSGKQEFVNQTIDLRLRDLLAKTTGSVFPNLSSKDIKGFEIVLPTKNLVGAFCNLVRPLQQKIWLNIYESHTLTQLRDTLLPKLISGQLRVPEAEHTR